MEINTAHIVTYIMSKNPSIHKVGLALLYERILTADKRFSDKQIRIIMDEDMKDFVYNYIHNAFTPHYKRGKYLSREEAMSDAVIEGMDGEENIEFKAPLPEIEFSEMFLHEARIIFADGRKPIAKKSSSYFKKGEYYKLVSKFDKSQYVYNTFESNGGSMKKQLDVSKTIAKMLTSNPKLEARILSYIAFFHLVLEERGNLDMFKETSSEEIIYDFLDTVCRKFLSFAKLFPKIHKTSDNRYDFFSLGESYVETNTQKLDMSIMSAVFTDPSMRVQDLGWVLLTELSEYCNLVIENITDKMYETINAPQYEGYYDDFMDDIEDFYGEDDED